MSELMQDGLLHIHPQWDDVLRRSGLNSFSAMMSACDGRRVGWHKNRCETYRLKLCCGNEVFIKRDIATERSTIANDLLHFRKSQPMTHKEYLAIESVASLGIRTQEVISHGQRRRLGLAHQGFLMTLPLAGQSLEELYKSGPSMTERAAVLSAMCDAIARIEQAGLCWPDLRPRHVFVDGPGTIGLLDLERLAPQSRHNCRRVVRCWGLFVKELKAAGAGKEDFVLLKTLMAGNPSIEEVCAQAIES